MEWYEHLFGILAIFTCAGYVLASLGYAAVRVGSMSDKRLDRLINHAKIQTQSEDEQECPVITITNRSTTATAEQGYNVNGIMRMVMSRDR